MIWTSEQHHLVKETFGHDKRFISKEVYRSPPSVDLALSIDVPDVRSEPRVQGNPER